MNTIEPVVGDRSGEGAADKDFSRAIEPDELWLRRAGPVRDQTATSKTREQTGMAGVEEDRVRDSHGVTGQVFTCDIQTD